MENLQLIPVSPDSGPNSGPGNCKHSCATTAQHICQTHRALGTFFHTAVQCSLPALGQWFPDMKIKEESWTLLQPCCPIIARRQAAGVFVMLYINRLRVWKVNTQNLYNLRHRKLIYFFTLLLAKEHIPALRHRFVSLILFTRSGSLNSGYSAKIDKTNISVTPSPLTRDNLHSQAS